MVVDRRVTDIQARRQEGLFHRGGKGKEGPGDLAQGASWNLERTWKVYGSISKTGQSPPQVPVTSGPRPPCGTKGTPTEGPVLIFNMLWSSWCPASWLPRIVL